MFLRKKKNKSGSISVQIISKSYGKYKVIKTIGSGITEQEIQRLYYLGKQELERLSFQPKLFVSETDKIEQITFKHTKQILGGNISVVFYDMTTLYNEAVELPDNWRNKIIKFEGLS